MKKLIPVALLIFGIAVITLGVRAILIDEDIGRKLHSSYIAPRWRRSLTSLLFVGCGLASVYYAWLCHKQIRLDNDRQDSL